MCTCTRTFQPRLDIDHTFPVTVGLTFYLNLPFFCPVMMSNYFSEGYYIVGLVCNRLQLTFGSFSMKIVNVTTFLSYNSESYIIPETLNPSTLFSIGLLSTNVYVI